MIDSTDLAPYLILWIFALALLVWKTWRKAGAGLMLAYCFQMFILYWVGAAAHVLPWSNLPSTDYVYLGFQQATWGLLSFAFGAIAIGPRVVKQITQKIPSQIAPDLRLPRAYIVYGIFSYFLLAPTLGRLKGFGAIASVGSQLVVVGCCLNCWKAWQTGGKPALMRALGPTLLIPCVTTVVQGFLGFGVMAISTIVVFCAQFFRPRWILIAGLIVSCYLGLSVYTNYMKGRTELRQTVWDQDSRLKDKVNKFAALFQDFQFFDPYSDDHLAAIDDRLNQDALVGAAVTYLGNNGAWAHGETLFDAVIAMIPRVVWPDKPIAAGSNGLATRFTGEVFSENTSVGVGPVLELYANFGTPAVVFGFMFLGAAVASIDALAGVYLRTGHWLNFGTCCLVGISFLNVSGSFVEVSMAAVASLVLARIVNSILKRKLKSGPPAPDRPSVQWVGA